SAGGLGPFLSSPRTSPWIPWCPPTAPSAFARPSPIPGCWSSTRLRGNVATGGWRGCGAYTRRSLPPKKTCSPKLNQRVLSDSDCAERLSGNLVHSLEGPPCLIPPDARSHCCQCSATPKANAVPLPALSSATTPAPAMFATRAPTATSETSPQQRRPAAPPWGLVPPVRSPSFLVVR